MVTQKDMDVADAFHERRRRSGRFAKTDGYHMWSGDSVVARMTPGGILEVVEDDQLRSYEKRYVGAVLGLAVRDGVPTVRVASITGPVRHWGAPSAASLRGLNEAGRLRAFEFQQALTGSEEEAHEARKQHILAEAAAEREFLRKFWAGESARKERKRRKRELKESERFRDAAVAGVRDVVRHLAFPPESVRGPIHTSPDLRVDHYGYGEVGRLMPTVETLGNALADVPFRGPFGDRKRTMRCRLGSFEDHDELPDQYYGGKKTAPVLECTQRKADGSVACRVFPGVEGEWTMTERRTPRCRELLGGRFEDERVGDYTISL